MTPAVSARNGCLRVAPAGGLLKKPGARQLRGLSKSPAVRLLPLFAPPGMLSWRITSVRNGIPDAAHAVLQQALEGVSSA